MGTKDTQHDGGEAGGAPRRSDTGTAERSLGGRRPMGWLFSRSRKAIRLTTYMFVVSLGSGTLLARSGYAHIKASAMHFGDELVRITESARRDGGDYYKLHLNGAVMNIATASTHLPFRDVLAWFKTACEERADGLVEEFADLRTALGPGLKPSAPGWPGLGVFREENQDRGMVLCFAQGGRTDYQGAIERLREFAKTGDLGAVGGIRYVFARKAQGGAQVVAAWTDGSFPLAEMFPSEGDAPGTDVNDAVRPDRTRRIFSAYPEGVPYGIRLYEADMSQSAILAQFDRQMPVKGWQTLTPVGERLPDSRAFSRDTVDLFISVSPHESEAGKSIISIVEMRSQ